MSIYQRLTIFEQRILSPVNGTNLFISDFYAAKHLVISNKIDVVINVSQNNHCDDLIAQWESLGKEYQWIPIKDDEKQDLTEPGDQIHNIIETCYPEQNILIHCQSGLSRAVSITMYHLLKRFKTKTYEECLDLIQETRFMACPNENFERQLRQLAQTLLNR